METEDFTIAVTGGLVEHNKSFRQSLEMRLFDYIFKSMDATPVEGAVAMAKRLAQSQSQ